MNRESERPRQLYRLIRPGGLKFDDTDRLMPQKKDTFLHKFFYKGSVPMITDVDLEFMQNYFGVDENWLKLTINPDEVESLHSSSHKYLQGLEYFGIVRRSSIVNQENCSKRG